MDSARGIAHVSLTDKKTGKTTQQDMPLKSGSMLMADNTIAWVSLIYHTRALKTGGSFKVAALYPDRFGNAELTINVRPEMKEIEYGGKVFPFYVCDVPSLGETHYVFASGQLMKVERMTQHLTILLEEYEGLAE